jgi:hypothetical protein
MKKMCGSDIFIIVYKKRKFWVISGQKQIPVLKQPPYSPDGLYDVSCLQNQISLKGSHFGEWIENFQINVMTMLKCLSEHDFQHCFCAWQRLWNAWINSESKYML